MDALASRSTAGGTKAWSWPVSFILQRQRSDVLSLPLRPLYALMACWETVV